MKHCAHCGTTILFGGAREGELSFCNAICRDKGHLASEAQSLPPELVARTVSEVMQGACPVCAGPGPVDVFVSHRALSFLIATTWKSTPRISCRGCATKSQLLSTLYSLFLGWWGIPWGFVMTPIQIGRNLAGLARNADSSRPSKQLEGLVRTRLAAEALAATKQRAA